MDRWKTASQALCLALSVAAAAAVVAGCRSEEEDGTDCAAEMALTETDHGTAYVQTTVVDDQVHTVFWWYDPDTNDVGYMRIFVWGETLASCRTEAKTFTKTP